MFIAELFEAYLSKEELKRNPGVEVGNHVCVKEPSAPHKLIYGKLIGYGRSGLAMIKLNHPISPDEESGYFKGESKISVPPSWVFANEDEAWPPPKWAKNKGFLI